MTPRQLMALADQHREHSPTGVQRGQPVTQGPARSNDTHGSAGWLMAVSSGLDRSRGGRRVNVAPPRVPAPGVG